MFWGSFSGDRAGPFVFWEKEWGNMTGEAYSQRILPRVVDHIRSNHSTALPPSKFMQDNASSHSAAVSKNYLLNQEISTMDWPAYSPDLNPIENVWSDMKEYIYSRYGDTVMGGQRRREETRILVEEAWYECTQPSKLLNILRGMHRRCEEVITAGGGSTGH